MRPPKSSRIWRCGHLDQVKSDNHWKCAACGKVLTIDESMENSLEVADMLKGVFENRRPMGEGLDEMLGRKEWEMMVSRIPLGESSSRRKSRK